MLRLILSGLVNWVCLDLEKNMKNEIHVLGWRFLGLMIFLGWFSYVGLDLTVVDVDGGSGGGSGGRWLGFWILKFGFCLGILSFSMGFGICLSLGLTLGGGWC